ncbi:MAG: CARDB domain-containing protein [Methanobacteriota archaeon]
MVLASALSAVPAGDVTASAQGSTAWFGPDVVGDVRQGWDLRLLLRVTNPHPYPLTDAVVEAPLDHARILGEAGWPSVARAGTRELKAFTLDPDSCRVVEHRAEGGGPGAALVFDPAREGPGIPTIARSIVPSRFDPVLYEARTSSPFDPSSNPAGTLLFPLWGRTEPGETRLFFAYFEVQENHDTAPDDPERAETAPGARTREAFGLLAGSRWIQRGVELWGYDPGVAGKSRLDVVGLHDNTQVTVLRTSGGGRLEPVAEPGLPNPATIGPGEVVSYPGATTARFKVVATKPVVAGIRGGGTGAIVSYPSKDRGLLGSEFVIVPYATKLTLVNPDFAAQPVVRVTGPGHAGTSVAFGTARVATVEGLTPCPPPSGAGPCTSYTLKEESGRPFFVFSSSDDPNAARGSAVADTGAPAGFLLYAPTARADPMLRVAGVDPQAFALLRDPARAEPLRAGCEEVAEGAGRAREIRLTASDTASPVLQLEAVSAACRTTAPPGRLLATTGPRLSSAGSSFGGTFGERFEVRGPVVVIATENGTRVDATLADGSGAVAETASLLLNKDDARPAPREESLFSRDGAPLTIRATKPVVVWPRLDPARCPGTPCPYAAYLAGRAPAPTVAVADAEFRGYLVGLASAESDVDPVVRAAAAGEPATYRLVVSNRGRWSGGTPLSDTIRLATNATAGWNATLSDEAVRLATDETAALTLTVRPPANATLGARGDVVVTAVSEGNPNMTTGLRTVTELVATYRVGLWLFSESGPDEHEAAIRPGERVVLPFVVKNLGSVSDSFSLSVAGAPADWAVTLDAATVALPAGGVRQGNLTIVPPSAVASSATLDVVATSAASDEATARVRVAVSVNPEAKIALTAPQPFLRAPPGGEVRIPVAVANLGEAPVSIRFNLSALLPPGWAAPEIRVANATLSPPELSGVPPGAPVALVDDVPVPAQATTLESARLRLLAEPAQRGASGSAAVVVLSAAPLPRHRLAASLPPAVPLEPEGTTTVPLTFRNDGNGPETVTTRLASATAGLSVATPERVRIPQGDERTVELLVTPAASRPPGPANVTLSLVFEDNAEQPLTIDLSMPARHRLAIEAPAAVAATPGVPEEVRLVVRNAGNVPAEAKLSARGPDVAVTFAPQNLTLAAGTSGEAVARMLPARSLPDGARTVAFVAETEGASSERNVTLALARPDLAVEEARITSRGGAGDLLTVEARVANRGSGVADGAVVVLRVNDLVADNVTLGILPPGRSVPVAMRWVEERASFRLAVEVDPDDLVPEASEANNAAEPQGADTPFAAWLWIASAALAAGLGRRRRRGP